MNNTIDPEQFEEEHKADLRENAARNLYYDLIKTPRPDIAVAKICRVLNMVYQATKAEYNK